MYRLRTTDLTTMRVLPRPPVVLAAAALATLLGYALPAYPAASPSCFTVCSKLFYKHIGALMKCAANEAVEPGKGLSCATTAATKMTRNYSAKLQSKCGGATCRASYPATNANTCIDLLSSTDSLAAQMSFGYFAAPADFVTVNAIGQVVNQGCAY